MKKPRPKNYQLFHGDRTRTIRALNDLCVVGDLSRQALGKLKDRLTTRAEADYGFVVPKVTGERTFVSRDPKQIASLLDNAISRDVFSQGLLSAVALVEAYFFRMLVTVVTWYPAKMGAPDDRKVELSLVVAAADIRDLWRRIIERYINEIFYASPEKYFQSMEKILAISLPGQAKMAFMEIKATRDLLVHNSGIVNAVYRKKVGPNARAQEDDLIPLDKDYFDRAFSVMKQLVNAMSSALIQKYPEPP